MIMRSACLDEAEAIAMGATHNRPQMRSTRETFIKALQSDERATASRLRRRESRGQALTRPRLPENPGVPQGVAARLRPDAEPVRAGTDRDLGEQPPAAGADRVHNAVVPAREPQYAAVG